MSRPVLIRPGGRSERIQKAVHEAVRALQAENAEITVALIADRAAVTPSTIYRRWGSLAELLGDVATQHMRPDAQPVSTGSLEGDLLVWLDQFVDEISTGVGRAMIRERVENVALARIAAGYAFANLETLVWRAVERGEPAPDPDRLMDLLVAPVIYRLVFVGQVIEKGYQKELVALATASAPQLQQSAHQPSIRRS
ncbi:TetR/AcrR family transcriptional regulator [Mesorhizobium sp. RP14(2022)]|uniref:TetR/AcrR family transcriptional regulator n=1 Tax=Mesorhizobium liriopis TaxID=2953882 RepID=A0ABT1C3B3_9HYPH|nr:TetR/AcrR family transcriptional regulator [Mesorhizobium liriopis]MCO6049320.1 TetR/AcrR family transcriptional regulator [Mesorhizobium liriopis]